MKSGLKKAADLLVEAMTLVAGCWLVYASWFNQESASKVFDAIRNSPFFASAFGLMLVLSVLLRIAVNTRPQDRNEFINFDSQDGSVGVSTKAIRDFIKRVGHEFAAIENIEPRLVLAKDALDVELRVKVQAGNRIPELSQLLQRRIRESVRESLGLEGIRNIRIKVQEIVGEPVPAPPRDDG